MKLVKCPTCGMTVKAQGECPICHTTITYEPVFYGEEEKYIFNKYLIKYIAKRAWFSAVCFAFVLITVIVLRRAFVLSLSALLLSAIALTITLFPLPFYCWKNYKYTEEYLKVKYTVKGYIASIVSVFLAIVLYFV